jgi:hypothetical protein
MRRFLIDWPATAFNAWWAGYRWLLTLVIMIVVTLTGLSLVLAAFGVRWGW